MFTSDLNAGVVPQMSPPPHDLERLRTTMVDFIVLSIKLVFMVLGGFLLSIHIYAATIPGEAG